MKLAFPIFVVILIAAAVFLVTGLSAVWAPDRPVDRLIPRWANAPSQFLDVQGMKAHLRDEGPHVLTRCPSCCCTAPSASLHPWDSWAAALRGQRRILQFNLAAVLARPGRTPSTTIRSKPM